MGSYFGSKATSGLCQPIIALMPPHHTYIETHLGGGAIMQRKAPALRNIGIDLNERALARFHCDYPVEKVQGCAHRFLAQFPFTGRELVYSDPPYLHETRSSGRRYRFEYTEHDHRELLALLKGLPCPVILSGYPSALYDGELADWQHVELQVMNQAGVRTGEAVAQLHPAAGALDTLRRQELHRSPAAIQAQGRELGAAVLAALMAVEAT
jgi:DNA adenine methylase